MFKKKTSDSTPTASTFDIPVNPPKKPFYKRTWFIVLAVIVLLSAIFGGDDSVDEKPNADPSAPSITEADTSAPSTTAPVPDYEIIDDSSYVRDGLECIAYRIEIDAATSENDLRAVYEDLIDDDYYLHTVFFYELASDVTTVGSYTVGKLEETSEGASPEYFAPTLSTKDIDAFRNKAAEGNTSTPAETEPSTSTASLGEKNAVSSANTYLRVMPFSYSGLIDQLKYDSYSNEEATYAADNCGADWNEQAIKKAQSYIKIMAFSHSGLIEQLEYDGFTATESAYGADNCNADWNEQAAAKAKSYLDLMSFSRDGLVDQLAYDGFTSAQCEYGVSAIGY